jgi:hypothetical protein
MINANLLNVCKRQLLTVKNYTLIWLDNKTGCFGGLA